MDANLARSDLYADMNEGKAPYASYIKTILGKVNVVIWDNFEDKPLSVILKGDPHKREQGCIVNTWSPKEDVFFKRMNQKHFQLGNIIPLENKQPVAVEEPKKTLEQATDQELTDLVNSKFFSLQSKLNETDSVAVLFRIKNIANDLDKSEKTIRAIEARISEIQNQEFDASEQRLKASVQPDKE